MNKEELIFLQKMFFGKLNKVLGAHSEPSEEVNGRGSGNNTGEGAQGAEQELDYRIEDLEIEDLDETTIRPSLEVQAIANQLIQYADAIIKNHADGRPEEAEEIIRKIEDVLNGELKQRTGEPGVNRLQEHFGNLINSERIMGIRE